MSAPVKTFQARYDDCWRAALATVTGRAPEAFPAPVFDDESISDWLEDFNGKVDDFHVVSFAPKEPKHYPRGYWIAQVPSLNMDGWHAIVCKGADVHHDPSRRNVYVGTLDGVTVKAGYVVIPDWPRLDFPEDA